MDDLLTYVAQNLVNNPDDVRVDNQTNSGQVNLLLTVNPEDMGLIIGKGGQTIKAIRKLLITKAIVDNVRVNLQLNEPEGYVKPRTEVKEKSNSAEATLDKPEAESEPEADDSKE